MDQVPLDLTLEFRGLKPAGSFTDKKTGEVVATQAVMRCEFDFGNGDVMALDVPTKGLDQAADFDYASLQRGDMLRLVGTARAFDREKGVQMVVQVARLRRLDAALKPIAKAA